MKLERLAKWYLGRRGYIVAKGDVTVFSRGGEWSGPSSGVRIIAQGGGGGGGGGSPGLGGTGVVSGVLRMTRNYQKLISAHHQIAGYGNITGDQARDISKKVLKEVGESQ